MAACPWRVISAEAGIFPGWYFLNVLSGLCISSVCSWSWFVLPIRICNASYHAHHFTLSPSWESSVPQQNWLETAPHASFPEEFNQFSRKGWKPKATNKRSFILVKGALNISAAFLLFSSFYFFFPSSSSLYVKGEDEFCLCQTLDAVKSRQVSRKVFSGVCEIRVFYIMVKNIFVSDCWQSDQSYHFAIFHCPIFLPSFFFPLHEYIVAQKFYSLF